MKLDSVALLRCLECKRDLRLEHGDVRDGVIREGLLACTACKARYAVLDEVGVFFRRTVAEHYLSEREKSFLQQWEARSVQAASLASNDQRQLQATLNWEYQWEQVHPFDAADLTRDPDDFLGTNAFFNFIPLAAPEITGKTIYVGCGGRGREAFHLSRKGPARLIVNELGGEIYAVRELLRDWSGDLMLLRSDLCFSPVEPGAADVAICDHALQHVADHRLGFAQLCAAVKPGGLIAVCVYSHENNFFMTHLLEPSKRVLHRLPLRVQRALAWFPAVAIWLLIHLVYRPLGSVSRKLVRRLPLWEFMLFWSRNTFRFIWMSCFDFIHAPISYHFRKSEMEALARDQSLTIRELKHTNGTMWSMVAQKAR